MFVFCGGLDEKGDQSIDEEAQLAAGASSDLRVGAAEAERAGAGYRDLHGVHIAFVELAAPPRENIVGELAAVDLPGVPRRVRARGLLRGSARPGTR